MEQSRRKPLNLSKTVFLLIVALFAAFGYTSCVLFADGLNLADFLFGSFVFGNLSMMVISLLLLFGLKMQSVFLSTID